MAGNDASFVDKMGAATKQLVDALIQLMKHLEEQKQKLRNAELEKQAAIDKEVGKTLKAAGFEGSKENIELLKQHGENIKNAEQQLSQIDDQISKLDSLKPTDDEVALMQKRDSLNDSLDVIGDEHKELQGQSEALNKERSALLENDDLTDEQQVKLDKLDEDIAGVKTKMKGLEKEMGTLDTEIRGVDQALEKSGKQRLENMPDADKKLLKQRGEMADKLEGMKNGEGLQGLKVDGLKESLGKFKAGSTGEALQKSGYAIKRPGEGLGEGLSESLKKSVSGPKL